MATDPESILSSTKDALGLMDEDTSFDSALIMYINATLAKINQLGVGPDEGLRITDKTATWDDLIDGEKRYEGVKEVMALSIRLLFDPPAQSWVLNAFEELLKQAEWRLNRAREDIKHPIRPKVVVSYDIWGDGVEVDEETP